MLVGLRRDHHPCGPSGPNFVLLADTPFSNSTCERRKAITHLDLGIHLSYDWRFRLRMLSRILSHWVTFLSVPLQARISLDELLLMKLSSTQPKQAAWLFMRVIFYIAGFPVHASHMKLGKLLWLSGGTALLCNPAHAAAARWWRRRGGSDGFRFLIQCYYLHRCNMIFAPELSRLLCDSSNFPYSSQSHQRHITSGVRRTSWSGAITYLAPAFMSTSVTAGLTL